MEGSHELTTLSQEDGPCALSHAPPAKSELTKMALKLPAFTPQHGPQPTERARLARSSSDPFLSIDLRRRKKHFLTQTQTTNSSKSVTSRLLRRIRTDRQQLPVHVASATRRPDQAHRSRLPPSRPSKSIRLPGLVHIPDPIKKEESGSIRQGIVVSPFPPLPRPHNPWSPNPDREPSRRAQQRSPSTLASPTPHILLTPLR
jgi:hypothetical protein